MMWVEFEDGIFINPATLRLKIENERTARQIVGSVNAAIIAEMVSDLSHWGNQTTALYDARTCLISEEAELMEANFRFWLDYAKGR